MAAEEIPPGAVELGYLATAGDPIDDARTDEIRASAAKSARLPDNPGSLLDILPFFTVPPDLVRQDQGIAVSPNWIQATRSPWRVHSQPPLYPVRRHPARLRRFMSRERLPSTVSLGSANTEDDHSRDRMPSFPD